MLSSFLRMLRVLPIAVAIATPALAQQANDSLFKRVGTLPTPRQMHGSAVLGDFLYVFGGELGSLTDDDLWTDTVLKSPVSPDGTIGAWTETTKLPGFRSYIMNSTLALNDTVYIVGGAQEDRAKENKENTSTAIFSRPDANGDLSPWQKTPPFQGKGLNCFPVVSTPGYLHVLGGLTGLNTVASGVQSGKVAPDGQILGWEKSEAMPSPLWFHNAVALGGRVWVWGGLITPEGHSKVNANVFSCPILSSGKLGSWRTEPIVTPTNFYSASMSSAGPYMLSFCPVMEGANATSDIWFTSVTSNGLAPWQRVPTNLPVKRYIAVAPDYRRGNVYIPGGRVKSGNGSAANFDQGVYMFGLSSKARKEAPDETQDYAAAKTYTYQTEFKLPEGALPGFLAYPDARKVAAGTPDTPGKPLVLYFNTKAAKTCQQQNELLNTPEFQALQDKAVFAWIDVQEWSQLKTQLGIYRVPTWVIYDTKGAERGRATKAVQAANISTVLGGL
ncbi:hypothetical protein BH09SUM1_BH09SUM1_09210 [soil metagenome]